MQHHHTPAEVWFPISKIVPSNNPEITDDNTEGTPSFSGHFSYLRFKDQNEIYTPSEGDSNKDPPGEPTMEEKQIYWLDSIKEYNNPFESGLEIPSSKVGAANFF